MGREMAEIEGWETIIRTHNVTKKFHFNKRKINNSKNLLSRGEAIMRLCSHF